MLYLSLAIAFIGTLSSTIFLILTLLGILKFRSAAKQQLAASENAANFPPVSVLKPVHGLEAQLKENIESFFQQNYPAYEIIFAADEADAARREI